MQCLAKAPAERHGSAELLASALRGIGPLMDWDEARASTWWSEFRVPEDTGSSERVTLTMPVDISAREASA